MKLLLTSGGIRNNELKKALFELAGYSASDLNLAFIPTAANIEDEDKKWLIDDLVRFKDMGFANLDIIDIAPLTHEQILPRLEQANIIVFGGGNTNYLIDCVKEKIGSTLPLLLKTRVLVGISAGSTMCCSVINPTRFEGLNYVDFLFVPHMGSSFTKRTKAEIEDFSSKLGRPAYWVDDDSAVMVNDKEISQVGGGKIDFIQPH